MYIKDKNGTGQVYDVKLPSFLYLLSLFETVLHFCGMDQFGMGIFLHVSTYFGILLYMFLKKL